MKSAPLRLLFLCNGAEMPPARESIANHANGSIIDLAFFESCRDSLAGACS
jgi:hypothetical protein